MQKKNEIKAFIYKYITNHWRGNQLKKEALQKYILYIHSYNVGLFIGQIIYFCKVKNKEKQKINTNNLKFNHYEKFSFKNQSKRSKS